MSNNLIQISSPEHFTQVMSEDLNRISLLNFWAPWAEPCKGMNQQVGQLAIKYPHILCLQVSRVFFYFSTLLVLYLAQLHTFPSSPLSQVEAESLPDVSESFDIDSVPSFVLLRGHTLLSRISGANSAALEAAVSSHASISTSNSSPLSKTSANPTKASETYNPINGSIAGGSGMEESKETQSELEERCKKLMGKEKVMLFMKGNPDQPRCGFSQKTVGLLKQEKVKFGHFDILSDEGVRQGEFLFVERRRRLEMGSGTEWESGISGL